VSSLSYAQKQVDLKKFRAFIFDLDGCIYVGKRVIPGAREVIERLKQLDKKILFATNNATKTPEEFASKLRSFGIKASSNDVFTSATATAMYLLKEFGRCKIYPVGGKGLTNELRKQGHRVVSLGNVDQADSVVVCLDLQFSYKKLLAASNVIRAGGRFIATNVDPVVPVENGFMPGAGSIVSALITATNREPYVVGKPSNSMFDMAFRRLGVPSSETVIVGDRLDTDIKGGNEAGAFTILVLSGATTTETLEGTSDLGLIPCLTVPDIGHMLSLLA
jgi:HAD superfamily hydrolase (TIGR01457 family)